ncbi:MAG: RNA polymerase sigma factor [Candidatus Zixiibacteriota bacterium]
MNPDWEILRRARDGDPSSWRELLYAYQPRLKALAYLITGSVATADDIAQETMFKAIRAPMSHQMGTLDGFLGTIAFRLAVKETQYQKKSVGLDGIDPPGDTNSPLDSIIKNEQEYILARAIKELDREHSEVLILRFYGNLSYDEIARELGIPVGTAKSRVFYAVKACRQKLIDKGILE